jgi:hypothetical protein
LVEKSLNILGPSPLSLSHYKGHWNLSTWICHSGTIVKDKTSQDRPLASVASRVNLFVTITSSAPSTIQVSVNRYDHGI